MDYIIFIASLAMLIYGADFIVQEAERIALHYRIPAFIIGATLVAVGTSLPEMAASIAASSNHKSALAVSNVLGSVTFNITLVLGVVFFIGKKINPTRDLFAKDSSWALFPLLIFIIMGYDGEINRVEGLLFLVLMFAYVLFLVQDAKELLEVDEDLQKEKFVWGKTALYLTLGFIMVVGGAHFTIESASTIALSLGVSEWLVGLFLISFGTSLPELVVSVMAVKKGSADLAIGNIIGSNVANFTMVLGAAALVHPLSIDFMKYGYDVLITAVATIMLVFITANRLYNKSAAIALFVLLGLFLDNAIINL